ncbi:MAG TPA: phosphoribosylformylglycinamidine synthase subunit PurQ [Candidatus Angelobacter sp.]
MKFGVIVFPGSNCDHDSYHAVITATGQQATFLWHESHNLENCDAVIVPGGFAYGDYLRTGAIARFAPIMQEVARFAASGGLVIGLCNGFQILCEAGMLPGALLRNAGLKYVCKQVHVRVENPDTPFTHACTKGQVLQIPVGPMEGNYYCDQQTLAALKQQDRIVLRYCTPDGQINAQANPNGSLENIAGICSADRNVLGMMPHPDRSSESLLGSADGARIFASMAAALVLSGR